MNRRNLTHVQHLALDIEVTYFFPNFGIQKQLPHKNVVLHIKLPHKSVLITLKVPHKNVLIFGNVMIITYFCRQITKSTIEWKEK